MVRNCAPENLEIPDRRFAPSGMTAERVDCFVTDAPLRKRFADAPARP